MEYRVNGFLFRYSLNLLDIYEEGKELPSYTIYNKKFITSSGFLDAGAFTEFCDDWTGNPY